MARSKSLREQVKQVIIQEMNLSDMSPDEIDDDEALFGDGLGLDSLDALQLAMALEEKFGVKIPEGDESRDIFRSVATIEAYLLEQQEK